ncbi:MAG: sensor histidine kinase [Deltaproteobacteria bacterium]|nr:MAG: sensor histidine kinase [Deltaproteobacteria bacterium]
MSLGAASIIDQAVAGRDGAGLAGASPREPVARFVGPGYVIAFVAVTLAGFAQAATTPGVLAAPGALDGLAAAAVVFALLGTLGLHLAEQRGSRRGVYLVLGVLGVLGAVATLASQGYASMMLLAVVSVGVLHLGARASAGVTVAAAAVALLAFAARDSLWSALVQAEIAFGSGIAFVFVFSRIALREHRARRDNERLVAELAAANARLTAQAVHAEQLARAEERNRIAREIHDGLGHFLTVVHIQLEAARSTLASDPERALAALTRSQQLTHEGLCEVRRSVALLRGSAPARPLVEALGALADDSTAAGVATALCVEGTPRRLAEPVEFTLYRAAQEALTNARRHARASHVALALVFADSGAVRLRVADDGVGAGDPAEGFGLRGMRERAEIIGGTLAVTTAPDQGFAIELEVP